MTNYLSKIENKLRGVVKLEKKKEGLTRLSYFLLAISLAFVLILFMEVIWNFNQEIRTVIFFSYLLVTLLLFAGYLFYPIIKDFLYYTSPNYFITAKKVGLHFPEIKDELLNTLQLVNEKSSHHSLQLVNAAFEKIYKVAEAKDFSSIIDFTKVNKLLRISLISFIGILLLVVFVPPVNSAAYRIINYDKNFAPPAKFIFEIFPGNKEVTKGESITIKIKTVGIVPDEITLSFKGEEQTEFTDKKLFADSLGFFAFEAASLKSSMEYFASAEGITSETFIITVINRPVINSLELTILPPSYTKLSSITQKDNGTVSALVGSQIKIKVDASRELSKAVIEFSDSTSRPMNISYQRGTIDFKVTKNVDYKILITDRQSISNSNPITYSIKTEYDNSPSIEMLAPNENTKLSPNNIMQLSSKISDDYGFSKMQLNYRLSFSKYRKVEDNFTIINIPINKELKEDEIYYTWNIEPLFLLEGEVIAYYLEVYDNDIVNGPKSAKTSIFTITVPSMEEILASAENTQENAVDELTKTFKEAEKLGKELQKISDDLKQNKNEISWQEKERVEKAAEKFKDLTQKIEEVNSKLSEMKKDLSENNLLSKETMEKYNELQNLLDEFNSEEMKEALKKLSDALKSMSRENVKMSTEELKANEEFLKSSLERTLNLLKRIQVEQKIDELVKRTEDLLEKTEELTNQTESSNLKDAQKNNELSKKQKDISDKLDKLDKEMKDAKEKMTGLKDMPTEQMEKAQEEFDKQDNQELSEEAQKMMQQMQKQTAIQKQQKLSSNMQSMKKQMQNLQSAMQQMNQMRTFYEMVKNLDDLLTLSKDQEKLKNKTELSAPNQQEINQNAREQNQIQSDLSKIMQNMSALSQKSFAITPEMGRALGKAMSEMQQAVKYMQNQNADIAAQSQTSAMKNINEAASMMKGSMDQMMNGGQGGGMMGMMQQLQQMGQQQMNINQLTQMMKNGQLSDEMRGQMQRLSAQQDAIRKSLEQLNREAKETGQSKKIAANLDKVLQEMKEVVTNLSSEKVDDQLIKQQERILSRLLDAQRSSSERDYEKNRKSNTGINSNRNSPPELILSTEEGKNKLKEELQRAIREGYKKDYEDLIRKYFEALQKEKIK